MNCNTTHYRANSSSVPGDPTATNTIADNAPVTVDGGTLGITTNSDTVGPVTLIGGFITGTAGILTGTSSNYDMRSGTVSARLGGTIGLDKTTPATVVLSGANLYSGLTTVSAGTIEVAHNSALGSTAAGATVANGARVLLLNGITVTGESITVAGAGTNNAGALQSDAAATATWSGGVVLGAGAVVGAQAGGALNLNGPISNGAGSDLNVSGGTGLDAGDGIVVVSNTGNTYTGNTNVIRGTLKVGATNALPATTVLDVYSGAASEAAVFDLNGFNQTVGGLRNSGGDVGLSFITNNGGFARTLTVNQAGNTTYSGVIQNGANTTALTKSGVGTLVLGGMTANTFTGVTTVSGGVLELNKGASNGAILGNVTVNGGSLRWAAIDQVADTASITMSSGSVNLNGLPGDGSFTDTITSFTNSGGAYTTGRGGKLFVSSLATWSGGTNDVFGFAFGGEDLYTNLTVVGGTNRIHGDEGVTQDVSGGGRVRVSTTLTFSGNGSPNITISSDDYASGVLGLGGTVIFTGTAGAASITNGKAYVDDGFGGFTPVSPDPTYGAYSGQVELNSTNTAFNIQNSTGLMTISAEITGLASRRLVKTGSGVLELTAANPYGFGATTGSTTISGGTLQVYKLANGGTASGIGASSAAAANLIFNNGAILKWVSDGLNNDSTNRLVTFATGSGVIDASGGALAVNFNGVGALAFTGSPVNQAKTLTLTGSGGTNANPNQWSPTLGNNNTGVNSFVKSGTGVWKVNAVSGYTGATTIDNGTLIVTNLQAGGTNSNLGASTNAVGNLIIGSSAVGTLRFEGAGGVNNSTNRLFTLGASGGAIDASGAAGTPLSFTNTGSIALGGASTTPRTLTLAGDNTDLNTLTPIIVDGTGAGITSLMKSGAGTWVPAAVNTYTGVTTVGGGILQVNNLKDGGTASNIGQATSAAANLVVVGGTLRYTGPTQSTNHLFTIGDGGATIDGTGTGGLTFSNAGALAHTGVLAHTLTLTGTSTANQLSSSLGDGALAASLVKSGGGTWTLGGANTYTGTTGVNAGMLSIRHNTALGTVAGGTTVLAGASLELQNDITVGAEALSITGTGSASNGALRNLSGSNTFGGMVTVTGGSATIQSDAGLLTLNGATAISAAGQAVTVAGAGNTTVSGIITGAAGSITKVGAGILEFAGANDYTGATNVFAGVLRSGASNVLPDASDVVIAPNVASGTALLDLNGKNDTVKSLTLGGAALSTATVQTGAGVMTLGGDVTYDASSNAGGASITGNLNLGAATRTFTVGESTNAGTDLTVGAAISGAVGLTKLGIGTMELTGANTYSGMTTVSAGMLRLNRAIADNSAIATDGVAANTDITINGGTLAILQSEQIGNNAGIVMTDGAFNFGGATGKTETIGTFSNSGGTFTLGANTLIGTGNSITWSGGTNTISAGGTMSDSHWLITGGTNIVEGGATQGTLEVLGSGAGLEFGGTSSPTITLNSDNAQGGRILLHGNVTVLGTLTSGTAEIRNGGTAANPGYVDLNGATRTFTIADANGSATDLLVAVPIVGNASAGLTKEGAGTLELTAANTYLGLTTVNAGELLVNATGSLASSNNLTVNNSGVATFNNVQTLGTVNVNNSGTVSFNGASGAVASLNGASTSASVTLGSGTVLTVSSGAFAGAIVGASGSLVKDTAGTLTLTGTNTFGGTTTIDGTLVAGAAGTSGALGGTSSVTVNNSGTLLLGGSNSAVNNQVNDSAAIAITEQATLSMEGLSDARENLGALTLTGNSIIDFGSGSGDTLKFTSITFGAGFSSLSIYNWSGSIYTMSMSADTGSPTQDRLAVTSPPDLGPAGPSGNWAKISFYSDNGMTWVGNARQISFEGGYELVPVPEPTTILGGLALVGLIGYRERRRVRSLLQRFVKKHEA